MNQGLHLGGADVAARKRRHDDRGFRRRAVTHKDRLFGHGQVHPRGLNRINLRDGARQLLLHGGGVTHLLHELAGRHGRLVLQRIDAGVAGLGQPFGRQENPRLMKACAGHRDLAVGRVQHRFEVRLLEGFKCRLLI